jgi:hypothetical protein
MRSIIAALRSLTLPFGATSGARIELDGVNGEIRIYDVDSNLLMTLNSDGFRVYDSDENVRLWIAIPGSEISSAYSLIEWITTRTDQTNPGIISLYDTQARNRMVISPGTNDDRGCIEWTLAPEDADILKEAMLQAVCLTLDKVDNLRPTIDLTGANSQAGNEPRTVVHDLWYGHPNDFGTSPTMVGSYGRGMVAQAIQDSDVTIPATAGTYATIATTAGFPVEAGRAYKCTLGGGHGILTGGSGFAVGDYWEFTLERDVNASGVWDQLPGSPIIQRVRANVAIAARYPIPQAVGYYFPSAGATARVRARVVKGSGAGTVTSICGTNSSTSYLHVTVEDVGLAL